MKKLIVILFLGLLFLGCAGMTSKKKTETQLVEKLDSWVGQSIDVAVDAWGYPTKELIAPNGNKVYVFESSETRSIPHISYSVGARGAITWGPTTFSTKHVWYNFYLEVDLENLIIAWRYEGNAFSLPRDRGGK